MVIGCIFPQIADSKVHGANMGPTWVLSVPDGRHVGPNLAIRVLRVGLWMPRGYWVPIRLSLGQCRLRWIDSCQSPLILFLTLAKSLLKIAHWWVLASHINKCQNNEIFVSVYGRVFILICLFILRMTILCYFYSNSHLVCWHLTTLLNDFSVNPSSCTFKLFPFDCE